MQVTLLGTGSPIPSPDRAGPSTLVRAGEATLLFDCGRGVVMRLAGAGVLPIGLSAVLLTHLHSDHITDLNDVVTTQWVMTAAPTPLQVVGPPGTRQVVDALLAMLGLDQRYRRAHHADLQYDPAIAVTEVEPGDALDIAGVHISVHRTDHRPVEPTVGYRVEHDGKVAAIAGDTVPCAELDELCAGADLYVQTVIRGDLVKLIPNARLQDILDYHSTVEQAAQTATRAGVKTLVLTHYVPPIAPGPGGRVARPRSGALRRRDRPRRRPHQRYGIGSSTCSSQVRPARAGATKSISKCADSASPSPSGRRGSIASVTIRRTTSPRCAWRCATRRPACRRGSGRPSRRRSARRALRSGATRWRSRRSGSPPRRRAGRRPATRRPAAPATRR